MVPKQYIISLRKQPSTNFCTMKRTLQLAWENMYIFLQKQNAKLSLCIITVLPAKTIKISLYTKLLKFFFFFSFLLRKLKTLQHQRSILKAKKKELRNLDSNISIICVLSSQKVSTKTTAAIPS